MRLTVKCLLALIGGGLGGLGAGAGIASGVATHLSPLGPTPETIFVVLVGALLGALSGLFTAAALSCGEQER